MDELKPMIYGPLNFGRRLESTKDSLDLKIMTDLPLTLLRVKASSIEVLMSFFPISMHTMLEAKEKMTSEERFLEIAEMPIKGAR